MGFPGAVVPSKLDGPSLCVPLLRSYSLLWLTAERTFPPVERGQALYRKCSCHTTENPMTAGSYSIGQALVVLRVVPYKAPRRGPFQTQGGGLRPALYNIY